MSARLIMLPARLRLLYEESPNASAANLAQQSILPWLDQFGTNLPFFPEYTDHGRSHLQSVIATADALIPEHVFSQKLITCDDAVLLVLATLLHDAAMALTEDQFVALVTPGTSAAYPLTAPALDSGRLGLEKPFPQLFDEFLTEARRWDGRKLTNILGALAGDEKADYSDFLKHPNQIGSTTNWTSGHKRFFGEFIRQQHPRLAHHFALHGLPPILDNSIYGSEIPPTLPKQLPAHMKDLAGLVARSHGIGLRETFPYFTKFGKNRRAYTHNTHPVYLMALLRIADYLQIDSSRTAATTGLSAIRRLRSPLSTLHWQGHAALTDSTWDEEDAEALNFTAIPQDAKTFLHTRALLEGLQQELDTTWAVLGQVFSRLTNHGGSNYSELKLALRRVTSNIDSSDEFIVTNNPPYYPYEAKFDVVGADVLKLLVKPLYYGYSAIGFRELLQNALDAVRELDAYCERNGLSKESLPFPQQNADISFEVTKEDGHGTFQFRITDKGIGMTPEIVINYFLKAGASFRNSAFWAKQYLRNGESTVLRSGKFGIGALCAFLIGDSIEVTTRHVTASSGVSFRARLSDEQIQLNFVGDVPIGTSITIPVTDKQISRLLESYESEKNPADLWRVYFWYMLGKPTIDLIVNGVKIPKPDQNSFQFPLPHDTTIASPWHRLKVPGYSSIDWAYTGLKMIFCNGIAVNIHGYPFLDEMASNLYWGLAGHSSDTRAIPFSVPTLSIFDPNGRLPLSVRRDAIDFQAADFVPDLLRDVSKDYVAYLLVSAPKSMTKDPKIPLISFGEHPPPNHYSSVQYKDWGFQYFFTKDGSGHVHPWWLRKAKIHRILISDKLAPFQLDLETPGTAFIQKIWPSGMVNDQEWLAKHHSVLGARKASIVVRPSARITKFRGRDYRVLDEGWHYLEAESGDCFVTPSQDIFALRARINNEANEYCATYLVDPATIEITPTAFSETLDAYLADGIIPLNLDERKEKFARAYSELGDRITIWDRWMNDIVNKAAARI